MTILLSILAIYLLIGFGLAFITIKAGFEMDGINGKSILVALVALFGLTFFWPVLLYLSGAVESIK